MHRVGSRSGGAFEGLGRRLFEDSPLGIAVLDGEGTFLDANPALARLFGTGRPDLVGRTFADAVAAEDRDNVRGQLAKLVFGTARRVVLGSIRLPRSAQSERIVALFASALTGGGEAQVLVQLLDITQERTLQASLAHAQKLEALGQMASGIAHDFNNLITAMLGFADLALSRCGACDPASEDLLQIQANAQRARALVSQLLTFVRKEPHRPQPIAVDAVLDDLKPLLVRLLGARIDVEVTAGAADGFVCMDRSQLEQIVVNLAVNARDAMPQGGRLKLWSSVVRLNAPRLRPAGVVPAGDYVVLEVADTGTGIPRDLLDRIFEPFFTTKPDGAGTGLGLATVNMIVLQSGGVIGVDSTPGAGTTFQVYLPRVPGMCRDGERCPIAEAALHPPAGHPEVERLEGEHRARVMLVDDEDAVRTFAARALRNRGYEVVEAADGEAALALIAPEPGRFDVLVTDYALPGISGRALIDRVRAIRPDAGFILISGYAADRVLGGGDAGVTLLSKPFTLAELVSKVGDTTPPPSLQPAG